MFVIVVILFRQGSGTLDILNAKSFLLTIINKNRQFSQFSRNKTYFTSHDKNFTHSSRGLFSYIHESQQLKIIHESLENPFPTGSAHVHDFHFLFVSVRLVSVSSRIDGVVKF